MLVTAVFLACSSGDADPPTVPDRPGPDGGPTTLAPPPRVVINEVQTSNHATSLDEDGDAVDWIELYNADEVTADLRGWSLSDDPDEPRKWILPTLKLAPGAFRVIFASGKDRPTAVAAWDTRVDRGDPWRFLEVTSAPDPDWMRPGYDDAGWDVAPSGFGRGDEDDATAVWAPTVYVRTRFVLTADERDDLVTALLHVDYDDAFVAYLNGVEVARAGIVSDGPPAWNQPADSPSEASLYQAKPPPSFDLHAALEHLVEGDNTLAVEVHDAAGSSDLTLIPILSLGFSTDRAGRDSSAVALQPTAPHTSFELKSEGERVRLFDAAGREVDDVEPGPMLADQSYGRRPDGTGDLGYFLEPTPGAPNTTESRRGFAERPVFDPPQGHYPDGVEVRVTAADGARVRVAWGGAEPTEADPVITGPLDVDGAGEAPVLRARAYQDGLWPSRIATATYLRRAPGDLPVVSLVTDPPNLWDPESGIYTFGDDYDPEPPYEGANFLENWERPVSMTMWEPDGTTAFSVDAGVAIHGKRSRAHAQRSFSVETRGGYGDAEIAYPVFPDLPFASYQRVLLRNAGNDWHGCSPEGCSVGAHLRDGLMHTIASATDVDVMGYRPAITYLNGEYWGIYNLREHPGTEYLLTHYGHEEVDLLELAGGAVAGDSTHYLDTMAWLRATDLADPANYAHLQTLIDLEELTDYLIFEIYYDNTDWPGNNIKFWRPRTPDGRWRWLMYDTDFGLGRWWRSPTADTLAHALEPNGPEWPNPPWSTELFRLLARSPVFVDTFVNRYADYLNTLLHPQNARAELHFAADRIAPEMPAHVARWGTWSDGVTTHTIWPNAWQQEIAWIDEWLGARPTHAREHVVANFGLAGTWTLQLHADPPGAGTFQLTAVEVEAPFTGIYFLGVPVTVTAVPAPGYEFAGWAGASSSDDPVLVLDPVSSGDGAGPVWRSLVARFE